MRGAHEGLADEDGIDAVASEVGQVVRRSQTAFRDPHEILGSILEYAERITALLPDPLKVCYLVSSGSEANELAVRLARAATGRCRLLVLDHAYHGNTAGLVEMSPYKFNGPGGEGQAGHIDVLPLPDSFPQRSGALTENAATAVLDALEAEGRLPAALFAETMPGCGGQRVLPDGFLAQ